MKIGSHNSFTYLKPRKWWMRLFTIFAKCQSKDIFEQYNIGARYFDLRFRFRDKTIVSMVVAHGLMEYDISICELLDIFNKLNSYAEHDKIYVRLIYELPYEDKSDIAHLKENNFILLCKHLVDNFKAIHFCGGQRKYDWKQLVVLSPHPHSIELYSSQTWKIWDDWCPWLYATFMNNKNYKKYKDSESKYEFIIMDFINNIKK